MATPEELAEKYAMLEAEAYKEFDATRYAVIEAYAVRTRAFEHYQEMVRLRRELSR